MIDDQDLWCHMASPGPVFCLLFRVNSGYAQPITGQVTEVTCPVIGWAQPELTPSKRQKTGSGHNEWTSSEIYEQYFMVHFVVFDFMGVNPLWPSDTIWWHRSGLTFAQVMACCLMAPSNYLNQYWPFINKIQWHSSEDNFIRYTSSINH